MSTIERIDTSRVPHEARIAAEAAGYAAEFLGSVSVIGTDDPEVFDVVADTGQVVAQVPTYRLRAVDPERLRLATCAALADLPDQAHARELANTINAGNITLHDPADSEWVALDVDGFKLLVAHRRCVVAGWPDDDTR